MNTPSTHPPPRTLVLPPCIWERLRLALCLSGRELEILRGVMEDRSERGIGVQLGVSPNTVHTHLVRLYQKLGVNSRTGLVVRVFAEYVALGK
jgi:DNA-binding CsgD family transcriptional regulator